MQGTTTYSTSQRRLSPGLCLTLALIVGAIFRVGIGLHWDEGNQLHPDERFLSMVLDALRFPSSLTEYFDSDASPLSPYVKGFNYYVYGTLPLFITRGVSEIIKMTNYGDNNILGRVIASIFDLLTVLGVYLLGTKLYSRWVGAVGAILLAFSVQNIQLSHFFGTENFVGCFIIFTALAVVKTNEKDTVSGKLLWGLIAGLLMGLACASKVSAFFYIPFALLSLFIQSVKTFQIKSPWRSLALPGTTIAAALLFLLGTYLMFRGFQPYAFKRFAWFDLSPQWLDNMRQIKEITDGGEWPPNVQWAGRKPIIFTLTQMMRWEMGYFFFFPAIIGVIYTLWELIAKRDWRHVVCSPWSLSFLLYQSTRFVTYGRYLSIVYPFFAIIAGYLLVEALRTLYGSRTAKVVTFISCFGTFLWAAAFTNIYTESHTRVRASRWIFDNIPKGTVIANESWDDGLPLRVDGKDGFGGWYTEVQFNHYEVDSPQKLEELISKLEKASLLVLSSNRAYATIPRLPKKFPFTSYYFKMLLSGELGFKLVHTSATYPHLFGFSIPTDQAVESFTVYDHPKVLLFQKTDAFNPEYVRARLQNFPRGEFEQVTKIKTVEVPWVYASQP